MLIILVCAIEYDCLGSVSSSLANVSAISTTHINDTTLAAQRDSSISSAVVRQSVDSAGRQRQPIVDLNSIDLATATRDPFLDGCRVGKTSTSAGLNSLSLSILTAIFQVNLGWPVFIEAKDGGGDGDNWTIGAISRAKLQSNHHHQQTNIQFFTGRMPFLSPNQQCQSTEGKSAQLNYDI